MFKIGIVTDVHNCESPDRINSPAPDCYSYLDVITRNPNKMQIWKDSMEIFNPNVIAECGDFINFASDNEVYDNPSSNFNYSRFAEIKEAFENVPHNASIHTLGNHDFMSYSAGVNFKPDWLIATGLSNTYYSVDVDGVHIVVLDCFNKQDGSFEPNCDLLHDYIGAVQLAWLEEDLAATNKPVIVFSHKRIGSYYQVWSINDYNAITNILSNSGKVVCCFNGHEHLPAVGRSTYPIRMVVGGVNYISLEGMADDLYPTANFAKVSIDFNNKRLILDGNGNQQSFDFNFTANNFVYSPSGEIPDPEPDPAPQVDPEDEPTENTIPVSTTTSEQALVSQESSYFSLNNKYSHIPEQTINNIKYRADEYIDPNGNKGYQIYNLTNKKSFGRGIEAPHRSY